MNPLIFFVVIGFASLTLAITCLSVSGDICCWNNCTLCGVCTGNSTIDALCCDVTIKNDSVYCYQVSEPPCINENINQNSTDSSTPASGNQNNDIQNFIHWIKTANPIFVAIFFAGACIVLVFVCYSCCCFGNKEPPIKYAAIVGKYGANKGR